jgi:hypothetical protein
VYGDDGICVYGDDAVHIADFIALGVLIACLLEAAAVILSRNKS